MLVEETNNQAEDRNDEFLRALTRREAGFIRSRISTHADTADPVHSALKSNSCHSDHPSA